MKEMKRIISMVLCLVMVLSLLPVGAVRAHAAETIETGNVVDAAIVFSDLHTNKNDYKESTVKGIMTALKNTGLPFSSVTSGGDAFSVNKDTDSAPNGKYTGLTSTISGYIRNYLGKDTIPVSYVWSDHDRYAVLEDGETLLDKTSHLSYGAGADGKYGTADDANYYVYNLSMGDLCSYDRYTAGFNYTQSNHANRASMGFTATVSDAIDKFEADVAKLHKDRPLLIVSHQPLFNRRNDNAWAKDWFDAINAVAANMDVVYFFGHNHNYDKAEDYYYAKGSYMPVATADNWGWNYETGAGYMGYKPSMTLSADSSVALNFTHMCMGYLSPETKGSTTRTGTAVAVTVFDNAIGLNTYNASGKYTDKYAVNETINRDHKLTAISVTAPEKVNYVQGETFDATGLTVTATYGSTRQVEVTEGYTVSEVDMNQVGEQTVTVTYQDKTATFTINVAEDPNATPTLVSIAITKLPTKLTYKVDEMLDTDGMEVTATYSDGQTAVITEDEWSVDNVDMTTPGTKKVGVSCTMNEKTFWAFFEITVEADEEPTEPETKETTFFSKDTFAAVTATATGATLTYVQENAKADELLEYYWRGYDISLEGQAADTSVTVKLWLDPDAMTSENVAVYHVNENGELEAVTGYAVAKDESDVEYITISNAALGTYIYGTPKVIQSEGAKLVSLKLTPPTKTAYFDSDVKDKPVKVIAENGEQEETVEKVIYLDITGLEVIAVYDDGTEKEIQWNQFDESADGFALTFDALVVDGQVQYGKKTITVTYVDGNETATATFTINVCRESITVEEVTIKFDTPGVEDLTVEIPETVDEVITNAVMGVIDGDVTVYDIKPVYAEGFDKLQGTATVTLPLPEGLTNPVVYYVSDDGATIENMNAQVVDGKIVFTTTHFSTYAVGDGTSIELDHQDAVVEGSGTSVSETGVTNQTFESGSLYAIYLNRTSAYKYLTDTNNNGGLTIAQTDTGSYWTITKDGNNYRIQNAEGKYLTIGNNSAGLTDNPTNLTLTYNNAGYWTIVQKQGTTNYYLNQYGGDGSSRASGYSQNRDNDEGSRWQLRLVTENPGHTYSVTAPNHVNIPALNGKTLNLTAQLFDTPTNGTKTEITGLTPTFTLVEGKGTAGVVTIDGTVATLTGKTGVAVVRATYTSGDLTAWAEFVIDARTPVYTLEIDDSVETQMKIEATLDLEAIAQLNGEAYEEGTVTWSIPEEQQSIATVDENGVVTAHAEGDVVVTATWEVNDQTFTATISLSVVEAVWALELHQPLWTVAKEFKADTTYYTYDETTKEYTVAQNVTAENFSQGKYHTQTVTPINGTIVIKNVTANQTFVDLWAVIFKDGVDIGKLSEEDLAKLSFESSNEQIAKVDQRTGVLTFTGNKGSVTITAKYEYATGKAVDDSVTFSLSPSATYQPEDGTDDFPEYPNEGAIRFDKTATAVGTFSQTGITQMELSMTGVPYSKGVDVIVMLDLSSSMERCIAHDDKNCSVNDCKTRLEELKTAMGELETTLKASENAENIRIAVADFNGMYTTQNSPYYAEDNDETADADGLNTGENDKVHTGDNTLTAGAFIPVKNLNVSQFNYTASSGTNYDYAFDAIYQLGHAIKKANGDEKRDLFVIFMSDGAPNQYNFYRAIGGEDRNGNPSGSANWNYWLTGTADQYNANRTLRQNLQELMDCDNHLYYYHEETGNQHRMANAVKGDPNVRYEVIRKATTGLSDVLEATDETNMYTLPGLGATMYSVAFDIANDGKITAASVEHVLKNIPTGGPDNLDYYLEAGQEGELVAAFKKIAGQIVEAAKDVKVTDQMGDSFTMVFDAPNTTVKEALAGTEFEGKDFYIEVRDYALTPRMDGEEIVDYVRGDYTSKIKLYLGINNGNTYYAATAGNSVNNTNKFATPVFNTTPIGTKLYWTEGEGDSGISVTGADDKIYNFLSTGKGTHNMASGAYAYGTITEENIIKDEDKSVMGTNSTSTDLIIATPYFVYNAATKKMVWTAARLDKSELAITYFLYLDKSGGYSGAEGEAKSGSYQTNKYAVMLYSNYKGHECEVQFPRPQVTWNGAQVTYVFYLVNEDGRPVNRAGTVVPFSEAVYVTDPATYHVIWNDLEQVTALEASYLAKDHVPDVFKLFDENATYNIHVFEDEAAQNLNNHFVIGGTEGKVNTTYVFNNKSDATKYNDPDVYAKTATYLCKEYEGVSDVVGTQYGEGDNQYTVYTGTYSGTKVQYKDKDGDAVYGKDDKGDYTIVYMYGASAVHSQFDFHNTTVAFAVVWTPELRPDTVVLDFGLDVEIDVTKNDAMAPGLKGVRATAPAGVAMNYGTYNGNNFQNELAVKIGDLEIGTATVMDLNKVRFSLNKDNGMQFKEPVVFYYESEVNYRKNDALVTENMYSSVTVIPATTVYYEDEYVDLSTYTWNNGWTLNTNNSGWTAEGTTLNEVQDQDRPGDSKISADLDADNVYGYDSAYTSMSKYSMGSAVKAHVDYDNYAQADFSFYGTGFDIISLTSGKTGGIVVIVKDADDKVVRQTTVDTYLGYDYGLYNVTYSLTDGKWVKTVGEKAADGATEDPVNTAEAGDNTQLTGVEYEWVATGDKDPLYQIPVMKISGLTYGKYDVSIQALYYTLYDHGQYDPAEGSEYGSYDFYLDAIRIYDPTGVVSGETKNDTDGVVSDAYEKDGEAMPEYYEVRNIIINASMVYTKVEIEEFAEGVTYYTKNADGSYAVVDGEYAAETEYYVLRDQIVDGAVFIDGKGKVDTVADYISFGPNNEVYLAEGQSIAFGLNAPAKNGYKTKVQIGWKSASGGTVKLSYVEDGGVKTAVEQELTTATDMYYDITDLNGKTILITNTGSGIISITNVKFSYEKVNTSSSGSSSSGSESAVAEEAISPFTVRMEDIEVILAYLRGDMEEEIVPELPEVTEPETEPEVTEPETEPEATEPETEPSKPSKPGNNKPNNKPGKEEKVDSAELKAAVEEAKKLKEKDYTKESYKALKSALKEAEKVLKDKKATQAKVDEALADLIEAVDALETNTPATKPGKEEKPNQNKPGKEEKPEKETKPAKEDKPAKAENNNQNKPANNKGPATAVKHAQKVADTVGAIAEALFGWLFR